MFQCLLKLNIENHLFIALHECTARHINLNQFGGSMEANLWYAALSGFAGAALITILMYTVSIGGKKLDVPYLLGTRFVNIDNNSSVYTLGVLLHLIVGAGWGMLYVFLLTAMVVTPNWPAGILWGFAHGIFVGVMMGLLSETHPHVGEGKRIDDPGMLGRRWSPKMPYWILALHIIYGVCTLVIYNQLMF